MHAPQGRERPPQSHRKNASGSGPSTSPKAELKNLIPASLPPASAGSTLNPNAGGFQPGGLAALTEVQNEVLVSKLLPHAGYARWELNVHLKRPACPTSLSLALKMPLVMVSLRLVNIQLQAPSASNTLSFSNCS